MMPMNRAGLADAVNSMQPQAARYTARPTHAVVPASLGVAGAQRRWTERP